jgi:hypothetical protein
MCLQTLLDLRSMLIAEPKQLFIGGGRQRLRVSRIVIGNDRRLGLECHNNAGDAAW